MKKLLITFVLILCAALTGFEPAMADPKSYTLGVDGLACPFCAYGVEKELTALDGVGHVTVHIAKGAVDVIMKDGHTLEQAKAARAVEAAGFGLRDFSETDTGK